MKVLTVKNPWASLICTPRPEEPNLGIKDIENRTWKLLLRGRFAIHAAATFAGTELQTILNYEQAKAIPKENWFEMNNGIWLKSAIIGEVDIVDCVINHSSVWAEKSLENSKPIYNWVLENPVLYDKPILNVKGKLSFWEY